jgi:hypothetical protein
MNCLTITETRDFPPHCQVKMCHHYVKYAKKIHLRHAWQQQGVFCIDFYIIVCGLLSVSVIVLLPAIFIQSHFRSVSIILIHLQTECQHMTLVIIRG